MGAGEQIPRISFEEFLRLEPLNTSKHEWLNGIVYMVAGGTFEHGRLIDNVLVVLRRQLEGRPCRPYSGNFLVRTPSGLGAYPDVMVFCGSIQGDPKRRLKQRSAGPGQSIAIRAIDVELLVDESFAE